MQPQIAVKIKEFGDVVRALGYRTGIELRQIFDSETREVFTATINRTKMAKTSSVRNRSKKVINGYKHYYQSDTHHVELISKSGTLGTNGPTTYVRDQRFGASEHAHSTAWRLDRDLWKRYRAAEKERKAKIREERSTLKERLDAIGLSRNTFFQIAIHHFLVVKEKVSNLYKVSSSHSKERPTRTGYVFKIQTDDNYGYHLTHTGHFALDKARGRGAWEWAVRGRIGYARRNLKAGVFKSFQSTMQAYKGLSRQ